MNKKIFFCLTAIFFLLFTSCGAKENKNTEGPDLKFQTYKDSIVSNNSKFSISIEWPIEGNPTLVKNMQEWIKYEIGGEELKNNIAEPQKLVSFWLSDLEDSGGIYETNSLEIRKKLIGKDFIVLISTNETDQPKWGKSTYYTNIYYRIADGVYLKEENLPSMEILKQSLKGIMRDYRYKKMDENSNEIAFNGLDFETLSYPITIPYYNEKGIVFQYSPEELSVLDSDIPEFVIPYFSFINHLTPSQQSFLPTEAIQEYEKNKSLIDDVERVIYGIYFDNEIWGNEPLEYIFDQSTLDKFKQLGITKNLDYKKTSSDDYSKYFTVDFNKFIKESPKRNNIPFINDVGGILWKGGSSCPDEMNLSIVDILIKNDNEAHIILDWNGFGLREIILKKENGNWKIDNIDKIRENFK